MTSPISSLSKSKKPPLGPSNSFGKRQMPFRMPDYSSSERMLLNDIHGHSSSQISSESSNDSPVTTPRRNLLNPLNGIPKDDIFGNLNGNKKPSPLGLVNSASKGQLSPNVPTDLDLMSSMMQKLAKLEKTNLFYSREIIEKDKRIKVLEEKNALMDRTLKSGENESPSRIAELETNCLELKQQVYEMETFLADYGMVWIGEKSNPNSSKYLEDDEPGTSHATPSNGVWNPDSSRTGREFVPDFNVIIENVKDLNILAGDGESKVAQTLGGAKLKVTEAIRLVLYKNGIMMFNGPFRSYSDEMTQRCLKDLMDGYFPSELQVRYPDGVPIEVTDRRFVTFEDPRLKEEFPGSGHLLGGEKQPSNLVNSALHPSSSSDRSSFLSQMSNFDSASSHTMDTVSSTLPGPELSIEQFVSKLPKNIVRNGRVIDVRGSIANQLTDGHASSSSAELVETRVVQEMHKRMSIPEGDRPPTARNVATLRVKSEDGDRALIIKMKFDETIGDLRKYIDKQRPDRKYRYNIISTFPSLTYSDESKKLEDCGLVPNANLCLRNINTPESTEKSLP